MPLKSEVIAKNEATEGVSIFIFTQFPSDKNLQQLGITRSIMITNVIHITTKIVSTLIIVSIE